MTYRPNKKCTLRPIILRVHEMHTRLQAQLPRFLQYLVNLVLMLREIIHEVVPHRWVMLVEFVALHSPVGDGKGSGALKHERYCTFRDTHLWRRLSRSGLELLICHTVRHHSALETDTSGLELIAAAGILAIDETHQLGSDVAVVVRWAVRV
jgi:hypothetical protein